MTEFFVCFSCCIGEQPQPKRRRRIDRSMIGEPMNFVHTSHVGLGDASVGFSALIPGSDEIERWLCKRCICEGTTLTSGVRWGIAQSFADHDYTELPSADVEDKTFEHWKSTILSSTC